MEKIKERGKIYALHKASDKLKGYYGSAMLSVVQFDGYDIQCAYIDGYLYTKQELEVKEVDLKKELNKLDSTLYDMDGVAIDDNTDSSETRYITVEDVKDIAKHFFELGLKVQKRE